MKSALFLCDGGLPPSEIRRREWSVEERLEHRGATPNLRFHLPPGLWPLLQAATDGAGDLVRIAAYVYAADQRVRRGGRTDYGLDEWSRDMHLCLPVAQPALWSRVDVSDKLTEVLSFVSDDRWTLHLSQAAPERQLRLPGRGAATEADAVYLFSGGLDSLAALLEGTLRHGERPILVSHAPADNLHGRLEALRSRITARFGSQWRFPSFEIGIKRTDGEDPREYTQRTRSFLYASLGAAIAAQLGIRRVRLSDNGVVSLNLPINQQLAGATASRSTHPRFLALFEELAALVLQGPPLIENPLWDRTRMQTLRTLQDVEAADLIPLTLSCAHTRLRPATQPQCGTCSQCIDRRFAVLATGLERYDGPGGYEIDIFRHALPDGDARTMAVSYARFGEAVKDITEAELVVRFAAIARTITALSRRYHNASARLLRMLNDHGTAVYEVLTEQARAALPDLLSQRLPRTCLLRIWLGAGGPRPLADGVRTGMPATEAPYRFRRNNEGWVVVFDGKELVYKDLLGLRYLHVLLQRPGSEVHVIQLRAAVSGNRAGADTAGAPLGEAFDAGLAVAGNDGIPVLDDVAKGNYQDRLKQLEPEISEAKASGSEQELRDLQNEWDWIVQQLKQARGLGGRPRKSLSKQDQARSSVWQNIHRAIDRMEGDHAALGRHFRAAVTTGIYCSYSPKEPLPWQLE